MIRTPKQHLLSQYKKFFPLYLGGVLFVLLTNITEIIIPKLTGYAVDLVSSRQDSHLPSYLISKSPRDSLNVIVIVILITMAIAFIGRFGWRQFLARRTHFAGTDMKAHLWESLSHVTPWGFKQFTLGDLINRAISDVNVYRFIMGFTIVLASDIVFFTIITIVFMLQINVTLTLYSLIVFPLLPFVLLPLSKKELAYYDESQKRLSGMSELVTQCLQTIRFQRAMGAEAFWQNKLNHAASEYKEKRNRMIVLESLFMPIGSVVTLVAYGVLIFVGIDYIEAEELTLGQFVTFLSYVLLLRGPLEELAFFISEWQEGIGGLRRILEVLNFTQKDRQEAFERIVEVDGVREAPRILITGLEFSYGDTLTPNLKGIDLQVEPHEWVGVFGEIGSGKSTLLKLIAGLESPPAGSIHIDGVDLVGISRERLVNMVGVVPQSAFLFAGTIRQNLQLDQSFSEEALWEVLDLVQLKNEFQTYKQGLETILGEGGVTLSGGQRQRVAFARLLLRRKSIILLDDCFSAVDTETEAAIIGGMRRYLGNKVTVIWVAHRRSSLKFCDRVLRMEMGRLYSEENDG